MKLKLIFALILGSLTSMVNNLVGGFDIPLVTLLLFMLLDYVTGCICALVFKKSPKTIDGGATSSQYVKGLFKKFGIIIYVVLGQRIDIMLGIDYIRIAVIVTFMIGEIISITENLGLMGLPMPDMIKKALTLLNKKAGE